MMRSRKITPNAEVTNVLLAAFDRLREMINNPSESEAFDVEDLVVGLTGLASSYLPHREKASLTQQVALPVPGESSPVTVAQVDIDRAARSGQCIYEVDYDLIHDIEKKGLNILKVFRELSECGEIIDCALNLDLAGSLDGPVGNQLPLRLVFATSLEMGFASEILSVDPSKIHLLFDPVAKPAPKPSGTTAPAPTPPPAIPAAPPPPQPPSNLEVAPDEPAPAAAPPAAARTESNTAASSTPGAGTDETLRVNVGLLETLMNLAGELVLSRNQLRAAVANNDQQSLQIADQRLNQITSDLQDAIMRTRLQPIGNVFGKFPRVVRDIANSLHKEVTVDIRGKEVALDRSLIEGLSDPLTHMVRNAVDHGIESPEDRARHGKKPAGNIRIEARHEAGQVVVEIADDGKGIDAKKVAEAAVSKGLITREKLRGLSEQDRMGLIFLPGLSTAEKVTDLSGRGVGMDVVKTNLDRLGGKVEIRSELGRGSTFRIKLPLTLAIIPSLIVSVGAERFAVPQINVEELLRIRAEDVAKRVEKIGDIEVLLLRDRILPLLRLDTLLATPEAASSSNRTGQGTLEIAVVTTGSLQYALVVSTFHDTEEIVVKSLGRHLKGLREYAGATILGDGTVALILDIGGLAAAAGLGSESEAALSNAQEEASQRERLEDTHALLLFHNSQSEVCATPLDTVLRIEHITPEQVEVLGSRRTMQYRGASLPLVTLSDSASVQPISDARDLAVIVSNVHGREVGLLGVMPVDVVETKAVIDQTTHRQRGISGSAVIRNRTTLIADVFELVDAVYPEWGAAAAATRVAVAEPGVPGLQTSGPVVLLAEDSDFFRAQVKKYLEQDGYTVLDAPDGQAAWELLLQNATRVSSVVTDIEMPRMTGLELAQHIRADERFVKLPIIALTSLAGEEDVAKGRAAGIDDYQVKLDRDRLLAGMRAMNATPA
jgi:two-component system chemotaxis sensor kinase CheA